ncbi:sulfuric ester hydrolase [Aureococcus anophagefferens]|nr:sulfuric ester hydrolase [Aureococcus anophagefferens]
MTAASPDKRAPCGSSSICAQQRSGALHDAAAARRGAAARSLLSSVFGPTPQSGLPLREVTLADQFRTAGYATGMLGKWHLGQREAYLPASRGFDSYLGIPFSDDMGAARLSDCGNGTTIPATGNLPDKQYAGCAFRGTSIRGPFGDALAEADDLVGSIVGAVDGAGLRADRRLLAGRAWMVQAESAGSVGHLYARSAGYWNLIGAPLPTTLTYNGSSEPAIYDGVDQSSVWFRRRGRSSDEAGDCLFFFGGPGADAPSAARCGPYKLHYATGPGLAGCDGCEKQYYDPPMVFQVEVDPSEQYCVMKVRGEEQSTRVSSTFLDNNNPPFMEFYHFGCQPHDAAIDFQCFDWDRRQDHEVVFTGETLNAWPASNEQFRWDDRDEPKYHFNVALATTATATRGVVVVPTRGGGPEDGELDDLADLLDGEDDLSDLLGDDDDDDDDDAPAPPPPAGEVVASAARRPRRRRFRRASGGRRRRGRPRGVLRMGEAGGDAASLEAEWQRRKEEMDSTASVAEKRRRDAEEDERLAIEKGLGVLHKTPSAGASSSPSPAARLRTTPPSPRLTAPRAKFGPQVEVAHNVDPTPEDDMPLFEVWLEGYRYVVLHSRNWHEEGDLTPEDRRDRSQ